MLLPGINLKNAAGPEALIERHVDVRNLLADRRSVDVAQINPPIVLDPEGESARATNEFNERIARDSRLSAILLPILRERIDGLTIAIVRGG